jgi:hypothetical protein
LKKRASQHNLCCVQRMLIYSIMGSLQKIEFIVLSMASTNLH